MPNHIHSIVEIRNPDNDIKMKRRDDDAVESHGRAILQHHPDLNKFSIKRNMPVRLPKSISSFIAGFKSAVNTRIDDFIDFKNLSIPKYNKNNHFFQPNYHDHIIRNYLEYQRIANYILENPSKWIDDTLNTK